jgi:hypothetical protein
VVKRLMVLIKAVLMKFEERLGIIEERVSKLERGRSQ